MTANIHKDLSIILSRKQYGEADLIVTFLSESNGRMTGIARSSLISARRFGGGLEPVTICNVHYKLRKNAMPLIEEVEVELSAISLMQSMKKFRLGMNAVENVLAFLPEGQVVKDRFELLKKYIVYLSKNEPRILDGLSFDLNWITYSGFAPVFSHCCFCGIKSSDYWSLVPSEGAVSCKACSVSRGIKADIIEHDRILVKELLAGKSVKSQPKNIDILERAINDYLVYILGRPLKGRKVFESIGSL